MKKPSDVVDTLIQEGSRMRPQEALQHIQRLVDQGAGGLEIVSHYGGSTLGIIEVWAQDGVVKVSVGSLPSTSF